MSDARPQRRVLLIVVAALLAGIAAAGIVIGMSAETILFSLGTIVAICLGIVTVAALFLSVAAAIAIWRLVKRVRRAIAHRRRDRITGAPFDQPIGDGAWPRGAP